MLADCVTGPTPQQSNQSSLWRQAMPGLVTAGTIALGARLMAGAIHGLPDVLIALGLGILVRNVVGGTWSAAGANAVVRHVLRAAIILIGGGLTVSAVAARGAEVVWEY